jgi:hypothetical protein
MKHLKEELEKERKERDVYINLLVPLFKDCWLDSFQKEVVAPKSHRWV